MSRVSMDEEGYHVPVCSKGCGALGAFIDYDAAVARAYEHDLRHEVPCLCDDDGYHPECPARAQEGHP